MKKTLILLTLIFIFTGALFSQTATHPSAGDGSEGSPYEIATLDNLYWLTQQEGNSDGTGLYWSRNYIQTADIDASSTNTWDGGAGFLPIGVNGNGFSGSYDGLGYIIDGLVINRPTTTGVGFIGWAFFCSIKVNNVFRTESFSTF